MKLKHDLIHSLADINKNEVLGCVVTDEQKEFPTVEETENCENYPGARLSQEKAHDNGDQNAHAPQEVKPNPHIAPVFKLVRAAHELVSIG